MTRAWLGVIVLGLSCHGCRSDWAIRSGSVEPLTLTAGSLEELYVRIEVDPSSFDLEPSYIQWTATAADSGVLFVPAAESVWSLLYDSGSWGDTVRGDYVFERRGLHPFLADTPPGRYVLHFYGRGGADDERHVDVEIEILPPP